MSTVRILEELSVFTPLGIRFWDPVQDAQIRSGLYVTAWSALRSSQPPPQRLAVAFRTGSDIYAFRNLPGLRSVEYGFPDPDAASPPASRRFIIHVEDTLHRFLPTACAVSLPLPYRGVFPHEALGSPSGQIPRGFLLCSAPTRPGASWLAGVNGELVTVAGTPAGHAMVRVQLPEGRNVFGLVDGHGRFNILFPYPPLPHLLATGSPASPPLPRQVALQDGIWDITLEVRFEPGRQEPLPGTSLPDYPSLLGQAPAQVFPVRPEAGGLPQPLWTGILRYGEPVVARTERLASLLVAPVGTSP